MKRKIIQLSLDGKLRLALCDDGSVYKLVRNSHKGYEPSAYEWVLLPSLPDDGK